jgi:catechol 2,3-dioxygenase-like lactoylglutathione lyase family enzyme
MEPRIDLVSIITSRFEDMLSFYQDVLGFKVSLKLDGYVEFESSSVRFAITTHQVMAQATGHDSFTQDRRGQSFELAFPVSQPQDVDITYHEIVGKGAAPVTPPQDLPWNQRAAFFADPDGNIHEIFADLPDTGT